MEDNTSTRNNPWSTLSTITTFDSGNGTRTTVRLDSDNDTQNNRQIVSLVTPNSSLLIESLIQQLCTMFEGDAVRRNKLYFAICDRLHELKLIDGSYNMMEFETLRGQYQRALYHLVAVARASTGSESALHVPSCLMAEWSRYRREFQEISFIAAGGFGHVFKALHRLDGIEYAVKKITVRSGGVKSIMQHLEEVKTLAKLNHTNIVSYKGAWIEPTLPSSFLPSLPSTSSQNKQTVVEKKRKTQSSKSYTSRSFDTQSQFYSDSSQSSPNEINRQNVSLRLDQKASYRTGSRIVEKNSAEENIEETKSNSVSFRNDSKSPSSNHNVENTSNSTDNSDSYQESDSNKELCSYVPQVREKYATLYIQMALCDTTLQQWLEERIETISPTVITAILTQILRGLDHIHSRKIVHHDIKPSNIFISTTGHLQIQLGDFGLACPLQRENHHSAFGTHMYAAPEQLKGKCDSKSDIYSVGIVLLELLVRTKTHMERSEIIQGLRKGQIPTALAATYPEWAHIVSQLVQEDPKQRPTTSQLLQDLNEDKDVTIAQQRHTISEKENRIQQLQKRISILEAKMLEHNICLENL